MNAPTEQGAVLMAGAPAAVAEPMTILVAALGGEGGGVLADWLVQCGLAAGLPIQATSVPGVAQRTGATSYYVELLREPLPEGSPPPVFALYPSPGRVDVLVASEALEAARTFERGFVAPERTVLIASTHRVYTTLEKMHLSDGRFDPGQIDRAAAVLARRVVRFDMDALARRHRTALSAVLFGAMAGSGTLPWPRQVCEDVIRASGKGVQASLAGFAAAYRLAAADGGGGTTTADAAVEERGSLSDAASGAAAVSGPGAGTGGRPVAADPLQVLRDAGIADEPAAVAWLETLTALPPALRVTAAHATVRCRDYQDGDYAALFLTRLVALVAAAGPAGATPGSVAADALDEAARHLALWMCYEDVVRVADLKSRAARRDRVRREAEARPDDVVRIVEFMKPGVDEFAAMLPQRAGTWLLGQADRRPWIRRLQPGLRVRSSSAWGHLLLRGLARLAPTRRASLRYAEEHAAMQAWLAALEQVLAPAPRFARALAGLPQVLKGYGDTQVRGRLNYARLWREQVQPVLASDGSTEDLPAAADLASAIAATLASVDPAPERAAPAEPADAGFRPIRFVRSPRDRPPV